MRSHDEGDEAEPVNPGIRHRQRKDGSGSDRDAGEHEVLPYGHAERIKENATGAAVLARQVFAPRSGGVAGVDFAIQYRLADGFAGGDIADVYGFDNGSVAFMVADVEGRGIDAAGLATLIKFSLRAFASTGMTPEATMINLDRVYMENCAFEKVPSFASVFFGHVDNERRTMGYCSAGHDIAILMRPDEVPTMLPVTAPLIGVFDGRHDLFKQRYMEVVPGTILLLATDGITEARDSSGALFGHDRFLEAADRNRSGSMSSMAKAIIADVLRFSGGSVADDIAVLAARFYQEA